MSFPTLLAGEETIAVTKAERDWLYNERVRAIRGFGNTDFQRARKSCKTPFSWLCALRIHGRDRGGPLRAAVVLQERGTTTRYVRRLRTPEPYASTGSRDIHLRRRPTLAY